MNQFEFQEYGISFSYIENLPVAGFLHTEAYKIRTALAMWHKTVLNGKQHYIL